VQWHVSRERLFQFGQQLPAAPAGLGPVAFAALGRVLLYQGLDVLVALFGHRSSFQKAFSVEMAMMRSHVSCVRWALPSIG
jgi:hypothetical protein